IYKNELRSYRDLPMRLFEFGTCYRFERSGVLHGLTRVRNLTIDDAHHFCTPDQLESEILGLLDFADFVFKTFGYEYMVKLATRPADSIGSDENWEMATKALERSLDKIGWKFEYDHGGGAFYGPKIDLFVKDAIGRTWQHSTIQCDFNLPERFNLEYIDENGNRSQPKVIHRAILGSIERFLGTYIEHTAGAFPVWLSPEQARVLPISEKTDEYAIKVADELKRAGFRVTADLRNEKIGFKIRDGRNMRVPYLLVVGPKEAETETVSVNEREIGDTGAVSLEEFKSRLEHEGRIPSSGI
ncbi:MAG TPA: threonine--tRNA ligase, partial [Firmicutes bacterium]|nr:threonine--tRNA ligase [Bacillota bacterium]